MPAAVRVELLTRPGCHLCDDARAVVRRVAEQTGVGWQERSVDEDAALLAEYSELVPVVLVDGRRHAYWTVDADRLRTALTGPRRGPTWLRRYRRTP